MTNLTVDDLARDLKVRNEDLVRELVMMGFAVEGPESPLETDDPVALRAQLVTVLPQREVVEKRIKPTVIRRRMKQQPAEEPMEGAGRTGTKSGRTGASRHYGRRKTCERKADNCRKSNGAQTGSQKNCEKET